MAVKKCANGHQYDGSIYGDNCPFCPGERTRVINNNPVGGSDTQQTVNINSQQETVPWPGPAQGPAAGGGRTVIRRRDSGNGGTQFNANGGALLVGVLVSYDINPNGEAYKIYEGKTIVGRSPECSIPVTSDEKMSREHLCILYREAEGKFWAIDQNSSGGTYINGKFAGDKTELHTNDIIVMGSTRFIFLGVPKF